MIVDGKSFRVEPDMAVFAPAHKLHKILVDPDQDLTYIVVYAPPGPEQKLKKLGEHAFDAAR
jgi:mannose-6-phosphate isomerase-like protein (cupin superfamily)